MVSEGDLVAGYCKIKATRTGAGFGSKSSGKPIAFEGMLMFRVRDGKVVEAWNSFDSLKIFQRMGVVNLAGRLKNIAHLPLKLLSILVRDK